MLFLNTWVKPTYIFKTRPTVPSVQLSLQCYNYFYRSRYLRFYNTIIQTYVSLWIENQVETLKMSDSRRRSRGNQEEAAGPSNGLGGRNRPERPGGDMGDEDDIGAGPSGISEEEDDPTHRREIRSKYRDLINQVQREYC